MAGRGLWKTPDFGKRFRRPGGRGIDCGRISPALTARSFQSAQRDPVQNWSDRALSPEVSGTKSPDSNGDRFGGHQRPLFWVCQRQVGRTAEVGVILLSLTKRVSWLERTW